MNARTRALFLGLALFAFAADQVSKYEVFRHLYPDAPHARVSVIPGWFEIVADFDPDGPPGECVFTTYSGQMPPHVNKGALFGVGGEHRDRSNLFFAAISILAACFILVWGLRKTGPRDRLLTFSLGLILGGTLGNCYDRIVFGGVRDFLHYFKYFDWPVFNFADCCLVVGAFLLLAQAFFAAKPDPGGPSTPAGQ